MCDCRSASRSSGKTRPRQDHVELADPAPPPIFLIPDSTLVDALTNAAEHARWSERALAYGRGFSDDRALTDRTLEMFHDVIEGRA